MYKRIHMYCIFKFSNGATGMIDTRGPAIIAEAFIEHVHWFFPDRQGTICKFYFLPYVAHLATFSQQLQLLHLEAALALHPPGILCC